VAGDFVGKAHADEHVPPFIRNSQTELVEENFEKSTAEQLGQFWLVGGGGSGFLTTDI
jgi:hypothetical protein